MESPEFSIKSNLSFDSPVSFGDRPKRSFKRSCLKMAFDLIQHSPMSMQISNLAKDPMHSCGSTSSEQSEDDDSSQATHLDESFSFRSIDNDSSICLYDDLEVNCELSVIHDSSKHSNNITRNDFLKFDHINESNGRLIGDMSREHTLPILTKSRHSDLASIDSNTLADLVNGHYNDKISKYIILDARYPYEYNGGHINGAHNAFDRKQIMDHLFNEATQNDKPVIVVFHCEFSAERGPRLMREFRDKDRTLNQHNYPNLFYPEIYLLEGGYKMFYEKHDQLCEPRSYLPMLHDQHRSAMKFFRKKSKSWEIETRKSKFINKTKLNFI